MSRIVVLVLIVVGVTVMVKVFMGGIFKRGVVSEVIEMSH
jgi:hypothetical protein